MSCTAGQLPLFCHTMEKQTKDTQKASVCGLFTFWCWRKLLIIIFHFPELSIFDVHGLKQSVEAGGGGVTEVPVGVGPGQGAHAEPAEILHAPCAGHLVTAIQFLDVGPTARTRLGVLFQPFLTLHLLQGFLNHSLAIALFQKSFRCFICF